MVRFADGTELHGFGHYHETYRKDVDTDAVDGDSGWRIASSTLTRLRMDITPATPESPAARHPEDG